MDRATLETMLASEGLGLERDGSRFEAGHDRPMTLTVVAEGEALRFPGVEALELRDGLLVLERERSCVVLSATGVVAIERERDAKESDKRRTGFL